MICQSLSPPLSLTPSFLPHQRMDGEMYEKAHSAYLVYAQLEADAANMTKADFDDLRDQSDLVGGVRETQLVTSMWARLRCDVILYYDLCYATD